MKALRTTLAAVVFLIGTMTVNAQSMSIAAMRSNARFLTDRMAYTLGITDPFLIDEMYRINYDYIWGVNSYLDEVAIGYYYDDYITVCEARDLALRTLLGISAWNRLIGYSYFHRPIVFANRGWHFSIYDYDRYGRHRFYYHAPRPLAHYGGGHFFRPMAPRGGHPAPPVTPRGGHPAPGINHRGGVPHGGQHFDGSTPRTGHPSGDVPRSNPNNGRTHAQPSVPQNNNRGNAQPQTRPQTQPQGGMRGGGATNPRSDSNIRSSSRSSVAGATRVSNVSPTRTNAPTPTRGNVGGTRGGGRR